MLFLKSKDVLVTFIESYAKQYLATGMNDRKLWDVAYSDMLNALSLQYDKNGNLIYTVAKSPSLSSHINIRDMSDYQNGKYATTAFTNNQFNPYAYLLQQKLNKQGYTDKFGTPLKEDGIFGPKTQWASDLFRKEEIITKYTYREKSVWVNTITL